MSNGSDEVAVENVVVYATNEEYYNDNFISMELFDAMPAMVRNVFVNTNVAVSLNKETMKEIVVEFRGWECNSFKRIRLETYVEDIKAEMKIIEAETLINSYGYEHPEVLKYVERL